MVHFAQIVVGALALVPVIAHITTNIGECDPSLPVGQQGCLNDQICLDDGT